METLLSAASAGMTSSLGLVPVKLELESVVRIASKATTVVSTLREALDVTIEWKRAG